MSCIKDYVKIIIGSHTLAQKYNYLKYLSSQKQEVLKYDPVVLSIVATGRCTLSCDMCPTHSPRVPESYPHRQRTGRDMDFETFRSIIDKFNNAITVSIIGSGEPLLNKDIFRMIDHAAGRKMIVKTFSNGTVVEKNIGNILNSGLNGITISVNGHNGKEFKRMTGMGEDIYENICRGTERLVKERNAKRSPVKIKASFIIDNYNYNFINDMINTALKLGVDHIFLCNFLSSPYKGLTAKERVLVSDRSIAGKIAAMLDKYPDKVRRMVTLPPLIDMNKPSNDCDVHFSQIRFDGDGNISSCSMMLLDMAGHGNYMDDNVWNNDFFKDMRQVFLSNDAESIPQPCSVCPDNKGVKIEKK